MRESNPVLDRVASMRDHIYESMMKSTIVQLQNKCRSIDLPTYGAKEILIARIRIKLNVKIEQTRPNGDASSAVQANNVGSTTGQTVSSGGASSSQISNNDKKGSNSCGFDDPNGDLIWEDD